MQSDTQPPLLEASHEPQEDVVDIEATVAE
jgi:hypothetical protein